MAEQQQDPSDETKDHTVSEALDLLRQSIETIVTHTPTQTRELPVLEVMPVKMTWQLLGRCEAIHHLLDDGLLDEATIILRSLMWDAQRLMYLDKHPDWRKALILGMEEDQLKKWEALARQAGKRGRDPQSIHDYVRDRRQQIQRIGLPIGRRRKFPPEGSGIGKILGRESDIIGHQMYSHAAHSAAWSQLVNTRTTEDGEFQLILRNKNPRLVGGVAWSAIEYLFQGTIATAKAQEWDTLDELRERYAEIDGKFERLLKRKRQAE